MSSIHSISSFLESQRGALPASFRLKIRTARDLAEERRRAPGEGRFATALPALDRLLAGGLERGILTELIGRRSSGRFALVTSVLAAVTGTGEAAALIDLGDGFDPQTAEAMDVDLERLLWVRPRRMKDVLASAEVILTTGLPLVVIDLGLAPLAGGRGAEASWLRLARSARAHRVALLVASPYRVSGTAAEVVLEAPPARSCWRGYGDLRLLQGLEAALELVKSRREHRELGFRNLREGIAWRAEDGCAEDRRVEDWCAEDAIA